MGFIYNLLTDFATDHRGVFVTIFVLPISLLFDLWYTTRAKLIHALFSAPLLHKKRVEDVQRQILAYREAGGKGKLCTARGGWQSITLGDRDYKKKGSQIAINLLDILEINETEKWVKVEPLVSMGQLSHFLVPKGWTIPVLPEMDDLTVGGLFFGVGIECSSHKYGLFNDCVLEAEVVLSSGEVKNCSWTENRELFEALPWSYGTLGFLVSVKIQIVPCKEYVKVEYHPFHDFRAGCQAFREAAESENPPDFVESLMYSKNDQVVMKCNFVDAPVGEERKKINVISRWYKPWFYKHVQSFLEKKPESATFYEYLPLRDYFHRHTKAIFWELEEIIPFGNHPLYRFLLGWAVPPKVSFLKLTQTEKIKKLYESQHIVQDMLVPLSKMEQGLEAFDADYQIYPLWICPYRAYCYDLLKGGSHHCFLRRPQNPIKGKAYEMFVDLGAYGVPRACKEKKPFDAVAVSMKMEDIVMKLGGFQMLYAISYLDRTQFRQMFDHSHYDQMKAKYDPNSSFPQVFEKTCKKGMESWIKVKDEKLPTTPAGGIMDKV